MVSKSALIEIARAGDEDEQRALWDTVRNGGGAPTAARKVKQEAGRNEAEAPSPIEAAIRVRRLFHQGVSELPQCERFSEIGSATDRVLFPLDAAE